MTRFRPCIDLHAGQVKQIVGGTLSENAAQLQTNHVSAHSASYFASLYRENDLKGAHVIMLGPGNTEAAESALAAWPKGLQVGGGVTDVNSAQWMLKGAEKIIVTSFLFPDAKFSKERLSSLVNSLDGKTESIVIDLSCRKVQDKWVVAMNKWQTLTDMEVNQDSISKLEPFCSEFLVHAADNEGLQRGIDSDLVTRLGEWCSIPVTYAGGARSAEDLAMVHELSGGKVDLTLGSALDCFGGKVSFQDCVDWNLKQDS